MPRVDVAAPTTFDLLSAAVGKVEMKKKMITRREVDKGGVEHREREKEMTGRGRRARKQDMGQRKTRGTKTPSTQCVVVGT